MTKLSKAEKHKELFHDKFLMGLNSLRLLEEMLEKYPIKKGLEILVLACGETWFCAGVAIRMG